MSDYPLPTQKKGMSLWLRATVKSEHHRMENAISSGYGKNDHRFHVKLRFNIYKPESINI